jgi:hypothetical protein
MLPAIEALLRRVPPAGPPHAAAVGLLAAALPAYISQSGAGAPDAAGRAAAAGAMVTLRKFAARCCGLGGADSEAVAEVASHVVDLLAGVLDAAAAAAESGDDGGNASDLITFAAAQLVSAALVGLQGAALRC